VKPDQSHIVIADRWGRWDRWGQPVGTAAMQKLRQGNFEPGPLGTRPPVLQGDLGIGNDTSSRAGRCLKVREAHGEEPLNAAPQAGTPSEDDGAAAELGQLDDGEGGGAPVAPHPRLLAGVEVVLRCTG